MTVALLVLSSLVTWWHWPRGDARFVGKWLFHFDGFESATMPVTFDRNGWCTFGVGPGRNTKNWKVEDDCLVLGADPDFLWYGLAQQAKHTRRWLGHNVLLDAERHPIEAISTGSIRLDGKPTGDPDFIFTRVSE